MKPKLVNLATVILFALFISACSPMSSTSISNFNCDSTKCDPNNNTSGDNENEKDIVATVSGGAHNKHQILKLQRTEEKTLEIQLPLIGNASFIQSPDVNFSDKTILMSINDLASHTPYLSLQARLRDLRAISGGTSITKFPNGHKLPFLKSEQHYYAYKVGVDSQVGLECWLYLSEKRLVIYLETAFNPLLNQSFPVLNAKGRSFGKYGQVKAANKLPGGVFVTIRLPKL